MSIRAPYSDVERGPSTSSSLKHPQAALREEAPRESLALRPALRHSLISPCRPLLSALHRTIAASEASEDSAEANERATRFVRPPRLSFSPLTILASDATVRAISVENEVKAFLGAAPPPPARFLHPRRKRVAHHDTALLQSPWSRSRTEPTPSCTSAAATRRA